MNYQLHHGDCLDILPTLAPQSVDAVITDPPFKLSQTYSANVDADNLLAVSSIWVIAQEVFRVCRDGGLAAVFYDNRILPLVLASFNRAGWQYLRCLTLYRRWGNAHKLYGWMSTSDLVMVFAKPGAPYTFYGQTYHDVYTKGGPESQSAGHPAQKPLEFLSQIVQNVTPENGTVLDPFFGSGTTGAACGNLGRRFVGIEKDGDYFSQGSERIATAYAPLRAMEAVV